MPKQLLRYCIIIFCLCAVGSSLINYRTANAQKSMRELTLNDTTAAQQTDWLAILKQIPQYKKPEVAVASEDLPVAEAQISDSQIIGIVTDKSNSVLIYVNQSDSLEPLQLTIGEGWLPDWQIEQINPDSVVWVNIQTQESYTQWLFNDHNAEQKKLTTEITGIK